MPHLRKNFKILIHKIWLVDIEKGINHELTTGKQVGQSLSAKVQDPFANSHGNSIILFLTRLCLTPAKVKFVRQL